MEATLPGICRAFPGNPGNCWESPSSRKRSVITHINFEMPVRYQHTLTPGAYNWPASVQFKSYCSAMLTTLRVLVATEPSFVHRNG